MNILHGVASEKWSAATAHIIHPVHGTRYSQCSN